MKPLLKFVSLALLLSGHLQEASSFWFTDSSLFQTPLLNQLVRAEQNPANPDNGLSSSSGELASWLRVDPKQQQQQQQPQQQQQQQEGEQHRRQQQQCYCSADWLQNQTSSWLAKWLATPVAQSQLRLLLSNSTGAGGRRQQQGRDAKLHHIGNNSNHWAAWIRGKGNGGAGSGSNNSASGNASLTSRPAHKLRTREQHQQQLKLLQGERGPQGPKGEPGPRGEAGPSGLISVRDRDALFDLPGRQTAAASMTEAPTADKQTEPPRLVFVEAEQLLVVGSPSAGWRPLQLLSPLRDFRRAVSKFSLSSSEQLRRRLTALAGFGQNIDNSISSAPAAGAAAGSAGLASVDEDELLDGADEDDDDEEAEEEEDEEADEDEEDNESEEEGSLTAATNKAAGQVRALSAQLEANPSADNPGARPARRMRKRPSGSLAARSGAAAPPVTLPQTPPTDAEPEPSVKEAAVEGFGQQHRARQGDRRPKLRIAALNEPLSGNFHGIRGADFECKKNAARANIKGSFRAFLATGYQNLDDVVRGHNVYRSPVVNLRGETLANSWDELFRRQQQQQQQKLANPFSRIYSFDGRHVATDSHWPNKLVWHGANNKFGYRDMTHNCDGWRSDSLSKFGFASPLSPPRSKRRQHTKRHLDSVSSTNAISSGNSSTLNQLDPHTHSHGGALDIIEKYPCRMPLIVLCIETIAQFSDSSRASAPGFKTNNDLETNNMLIV